MTNKLSSADWIRLVLAFLLGVALTVLFYQVSGSGELFRGALIPMDSYSTTTKVTLPSTMLAEPVTTVKTDSVLNDSLQRLDSGLRVESAEDDEAGLDIGGSLSREVDLEMIRIPLDDD